MSIDNIVMDDSLSYGARGGPQFMTTIETSKSGVETRNEDWALVRHRFDISKNVMDQTTMQALRVFFYGRRGKSNGFLFKDWQDFQATVENFGTGNAVTTAFQLKKTYADSVRPYSRTITRPMTTGQGGITLEIRVNGVLKTEGVDFTVNYTTGVVTFTSPPANGHPITWTGYFFVPVRFDTDEWAAEVNGFQVYDWNSIVLVELLGEG